MVSHFFRARTTSVESRLEQELAAIEKEAQGASPGYETQFLNRAGNLCVEAGQPTRALSYYGRAIDAYLESGRFGAAEVLCRKLLQIAPATVRARCTLAWLAIGQGSPEATRQAIAEYVDAAERTDTGTFAAKQLVLMADATWDTDLRERIAEHLIQLEAADKAEYVNGLVHRSREPGAQGPTRDEAKLWAKLLRAALMGPKELQQQTWRGSDDEEGLPSLTSQAN
jgi:tetratricopeptide (TPR) repeat protein